YSAAANARDEDHAVGSVWWSCHAACTHQAATTAAGATQSHWPDQATANISAMFTADARMMMATGTAVSVPDASPSVSVAMKSAQIAPIAAPSQGPRLRMTSSHTSERPTTYSAATTIIGAHAIDD